MTDFQKKLGLKKADQIAIVVEDMEKVIHYYENTLGLGPFHRPEINYFKKYYYNEKVDSDWEMAFCSLGDVELELIQPTREPTIYHDFLKTQGEGLHHIGFVIDNFSEVIDICKKKNIEVIQWGEGDTSKFAYLATEKPGGVIYEIIEREVSRV